MSGVTSPSSFPRFPMFRLSCVEHLSLSLCVWCVGVATPSLLLPVHLHTWGPSANQLLQCTNLFTPVRLTVLLSVLSSLDLDQPTLPASPLRSCLWVCFKMPIMTISASGICSDLPPCIVQDTITTSDRAAMLECFNEHFKACGSLLNQSPSSEHCQLQTRLWTDGQSLNRCWWSAQKSPLAGHQHPAGPDHLEPYFLTLAADYIVKPLTSIFNLTLPQNISLKCGNVPLLTGTRGYID